MACAWIRRVCALYLALGLALGRLVIEELDVGERAAAAVAKVVVVVAHRGDNRLGARKSLFEEISRGP